MFKQKHETEVLEAHSLYLGILNIQRKLGGKCGNSGTIITHMSTGFHHFEEVNVSHLKGFTDDDDGRQYINEKVYHH